MAQIVSPDELTRSSNEQAFPLEFLVQELLVRHRGVAIAEDHYKLEAVQLITRYMPALAHLGLTRLFIEALDHRDQDLLDYFQRTGDIQQIFPPNRERFERCLDYELNRWNRYGDERKSSYLAMFEAARAAEVKLVAIDNYDDMGPNRFKTSNPIWCQVIEDQFKSMGPEEFYIVHGGRFHFSRREDPEVASVSERLGIPSIYIHRENEGKALISYNKQNPNEATFDCSVPESYFAASLLDFSPSPIFATRQGNGKIINPRRAL